MCGAVLQASKLEDKAPAHEAVVQCARCAFAHRATSESVGKST